MSFQNIHGYKLQRLTSFEKFCEQKFSRKIRNISRNLYVTAFNFYVFVTHFIILKRKYFYNIITNAETMSRTEVYLMFDLWFSEWISIVFIIYLDKCQSIQMLQLQICFYFLISTYGGPEGSIKGFANENKLLLSKLKFYCQK